MQYKNQLDQITKNKIVRGAWIALWTSAVIGLLTFLTGQDFGDAGINAVIAWVAQTGLNAVREYQKGV